MDRMEGMHDHLPVLSSMSMLRVGVSCNVTPATAPDSNYSHRFIVAFVKVDFVDDGQAMLELRLDDDATLYRDRMARPPCAAQLGKFARAASAPTRPVDGAGEVYRMYRRYRMALTDQRRIGGLSMASPASFPRSAGASWYLNSADLVWHSNEDEKEKSIRR
ncbi:hypothetical protein MHUMG1_00116 [Metarhizium humberi]|uniref:Uncharacterized protein n=1 Tax=Metarhizium humberi TaxID=2596975 RepID=A0A9P8SAX9_9HYPO|nr:hypothetical protein MHUMG1_00116 [Metarhizium humberi]